jgi:hypothetical protein
MKRIPSLVAALTLTLLISGCDVVINSIKGSGNPKTESRTVSGFNSVEMDGSGELQVEQTGTESLTITADDNILQYLTSDVSNGRLRLGTKGNVGFSLSGPVVYKLTVKNLNGIELSGSGSIDGKALNSDSMKIESSGSGEITTSGNTNRMELQISGSGSFHGDGFKSKDAKIEIDGSGAATVAASDKLDVTINGSGSVEYIGDPKIAVTSNGSGTVNKR